MEQKTPPLEEEPVAGSHCPRVWVRVRVGEGELRHGTSLQTVVAPDVSLPPGPPGTPGKPGSP